MSDLTTRHNSSTCTLGPDGLPCSMCSWANDVEARQVAQEAEDTDAKETIEIGRPAL